MAFTTINKSSAYMDTCIWDGNNSTSDRNITTGVNGADLVWTKRRNNTYPHMVFDSVRTFAGDKGLSSHDQTEEGSVAAAANGYIGGTGDSIITLKEGSGDSMYGLEVCKSLHLPSDFLEYAQSIRTKYNNRTTKE